MVIITIVIIIIVVLKDVIIADGWDISPEIVELTKIIEETINTLKIIHLTLKLVIIIVDKRDTLLGTVTSYPEDHALSVVHLDTGEICALPEMPIIIIILEIPIGMLTHQAATIIITDNELHSLKLHQCII